MCVCVFVWVYLMYILYVGMEKVVCISDLPASVSKFSHLNTSVLICLPI